MSINNNKALQNTYSLPKELQLIFSAGTMIRSASNTHLSALEALKERGVAFKDIQRHIEKQMKKHRIWGKVLQANGKLDYTPFSQLVKNVKWAKDIRNFYAYTKRNWVDYDVKKGKVDLTEAEEKKRAAKKSQLDDIKALERVVNLMSDEPDVLKELNEMIGALKAIIKG